MGRSKRRANAPGWVTVSDLARLEGCSHSHAWRLMRGKRGDLLRVATLDAVRFFHGRLRLRADAYAAWVKARQDREAGVEARLAAIENRVADLEDALRESEQRADRLALDLREARDAGRLRRA